ncbi:MAG: hypothetical protein KAS21_11110 [Candidatus Aminicenantes bacterium]|nr:hypothetical protein [Candidatus Aminicenantes bacterium]
MSEAALGGILHALRIPLTGLFIGSSAVIFISLIGFYSTSRKEIMKAMFIVLLVKAAISPHTPPLAYIAVSVQGLLGSALFYSKKFYKFSAIFLGIIVLVLSSLQKIILLTLIYGNNLWRSIDEFGKFITEKVPFMGMISEISLWIIGSYVAVHLFAGLTAGLIAAGLPGRIKKAEIRIEHSALDIQIKMPLKKKGRRKMWITSPSGIMIFSLAALIIVLTYVFPHFSESVAMNAAIMLARSFLIMSIWFFFLSPYVRRVIKKISGKKSGRYSDEIGYVIDQLPLYRSIVSHCWKMSEGKYFLIRIREFIVTTFACIFRIENGKE